MLNSIGRSAGVALCSLVLACSPNINPPDSGRAGSNVPDATGQTAEREAIEKSENLKAVARGVYRLIGLHYTLSLKHKGRVDEFGYELFRPHSGDSLFCIITFNSHKKVYQVFDSGPDGVIDNHPTAGDIYGADREKIQNLYEQVLADALRSL